MEIAKYWNTIRYLKPVQIEYQFLNRVKRNGKGKYKDIHPLRQLHLLIEDLDLSEAYVSRFQPELVFENKVSLLNQVVDLDFEKENMDGLLPLYRFNLMYFEYAIAWGAVYRRTRDFRYAEKFCECFQRYQAANVPYYSYVCSLQIPNLLITLELFGEALDQEVIHLIYQEIYRQYQYIASHMERHLLGNHYFENIKALVLTSYLFGEDEKCRKYFHLLKSELNEQILEDGMHFELSPMYHKIILEDLLRVRTLEDVPNVICTATLEPLLEKMGNAMKTLEDGFNRTPLFNDAGDNVAKSKESLEHTITEVFHISLKKKMCLPEAGYYRLESDDIVVLFDGGNIGPEYMPGHGHCDCLSYEMTYQGMPFIVNAGTFQYQGNRRSFYRSTRAHNTLQVEGQEQSEVWGEHRVAKRIKSVKCDYKGTAIQASCITYQGYKLCREVYLENQTLRVQDSLGEKQGVNIVSYIHLAPGFTVEKKQRNIGIVRDNCQFADITLQNVQADIIRQGELTRYAPEFGLEQHGITIRLKWKEDRKQHGYTIEIREKQHG